MASRKSAISSKIKQEEAAGIPAKQAVIDAIKSKGKSKGKPKAAQGALNKTW